MNQAEQGQPQQATTQHPLACLVAAFAADQKDRHAEQHGKQGDELLMEEDLDQPTSESRSADQRKGRLLRRHGRVHGQGEGGGVDREDAQHRHAAQHVQRLDARAGLLYRAKRGLVGHGVGLPRASRLLMPSRRGRDTSKRSKVRADRSTSGPCGS
ncbi:hypothetical protein D3C71_1550540 [compost metagenome]